MAFEWQIFLRILLAILRVLEQLPPEADTTGIVRDLGDAIELNGIQTKPGGKSHG